MSVQDAFCDIYRRGLWGSGSGLGSDEAYAKVYSDFVRCFATKRGIKRIVDIGCGDFRVGSQIANGPFEYIGLDVVPELIAHHNHRFAGEHTTFAVLDATVQAPPPADLCLIRQVLQHLSNSEIGRVLGNCSDYPFVLITEHVPVGPDVVPNKDKPHGPDTRVYDNSGVFVDQPPFSKNVETLLEVPYSRHEVLRTVLIQRGM